MPEPIAGTALVSSAIGRKQRGRASNQHTCWWGARGPDGGDKRGWSRRCPGGGGCLRCVLKDEQELVNYW